MSRNRKLNRDHAKKTQRPMVEDEAIASQERQVMVWLAMQPDWMGLEQLQNALVIKGMLSSADLLEVLQSLQGRSLIETSPIGFNLLPYIRQYLRERVLVCDSQISGISLRYPQLPLTRVGIEYIDP